MLCRRCRILLFQFSFRHPMEHICLLATSHWRRRYSPTGGGGGIVSPSFVRIAVALPSVPWLMCAVYRLIELKLGVVTACSRAISVSCLCRNSSNIRIRITDEIPLILSVATLYMCVCVCHMGWGWTPLWNHDLCGVACRVPLHVLKRYTTSLSLSVRNLLLHFAVSVGVINWCLSLVGLLSFGPIVSIFWTLLVGFTFLHLDHVISLFVGHLRLLFVPSQDHVLFATLLHPGVYHCPLAWPRYTGCPSHHVYVPLGLWPSPVCRMFHASSGAACVPF